MTNLLVNQTGLTPLFVAIDQQFTESVELMIAKKLDVNQTYQGLAPIVSAVKNSCLGIAKLLLTNKANINAADKVQYSYETSVT